MIASPSILRIIAALAIVGGCALRTCQGSQEGSVVDELMPRPAKVETPAADGARIARTAALGNVTIQEGQTQFKKVRPRCIGSSV